ncbi:MAG: EcsC family protein [Candidatus Omnitrophota bacterium]
MSFIDIPMPWLLFAVLMLFAALGVFIAARSAWNFTRILYLLRPGAKIASLADLESKISRRITLADRKAQELIDGKVRQVTRSLKTTSWMDPARLMDECFQLVCDVAQVYYPTSPHPELEVTIVELLHLNERISKELNVLIAPLKPLHQVSVSNILTAKDLFDKTHEIVEKKGMRAGRRIASGVWTAINALNPQYWINKAIFKGASEAVGRKILASAYRIVGAEAIRVYRSSSTFNLDAALSLEDEEAPIAAAAKPELAVESAPEIEAAVIEPEIALEMDVEEDMDHSTAQPEEKDDKKTRFTKIAIQTFSKFIEGSLTLWDKLSKPDSVIAAYRKKNPQVETLSSIQKLPIETINKMSSRYIHKGAWLSAAEGTITGFGGMFTIAADAVSLLALQLRAIQQVGYCHGFDVSRPDEKIFAVKLLAEAYCHPATGERTALLKEMRMAADLLRGKSPLGYLQKQLFLKGTSQIAQKIGLRLGGEKTAQVIPFLGAAVGGIINRKITKDVALIAQDVYRDRLLKLRGESQPPEEAAAPSGGMG